MTDTQAWGGLNPALTAWRNGINALFPGRGTASDGGYADADHGSSSEHQPDSDGSVDAFDMDVNLLASSNAQGSEDERALVEALKKDFEADSRSQLWIHQREIANRDVDNWSERYYGGSNPHDKHVHWQSRQSKETGGQAWKMTNTERCLSDLGIGPMADFTESQCAQIQAQVYEQNMATMPGRTINSYTGWIRTHDAVTGGTGNSALLWERLDVLEAGIAALAEQMVELVVVIDAQLNGEALRDRIDAWRTRRQEWEAERDRLSHVSGPYDGQDDPADG